MKNTSLGKDNSLNRLSQEEIRKAYRELSGTQSNVAVAVRSSATAEDLPTANFAGQYDSFLNVNMMVEIPSNVILADQFARLFDDFSIGSYDLTPLTLGLDRDSEIVSYLFDENNEAVTLLIAQAIGRKHNKNIQETRFMY